MMELDSRELTSRVRKALEGNSALKLSPGGLLPLHAIVRATLDELEKAGFLQVVPPECIDPLCHTMTPHGRHE